MNLPLKTYDPAGDGPTQDGMVCVSDTCDYPGGAEIRPGDQYGELPYGVVLDDGEIRTVEEAVCLSCFLKGVME